MHASSPRCQNQGCEAESPEIAEAACQSALDLQDGALLWTAAAASLPVGIACIERGLPGLDAVVIKGRNGAVV